MGGGEGGGVVGVAGWRGWGEAEDGLRLPLRDRQQ